MHENVFLPLTLFLFLFLIRDRFLALRPYSFPFCRSFPQILYLYF